MPTGTGFSARLACSASAALSLLRSSNLEVRFLSPATRPIQHAEPLPSALPACALALLFSNHLCLFCSIDEHCSSAWTAACC